MSDTKAAKLKAVGTVRQLDHLGRVVIPIEYRREIGLMPRSQVEIILLRDGELRIRPYRPACTCGALEDLIEIGSERRCRQCLQRLLEESAR